MIQNAKNKKLNEIGGDLPRMGDTITAWFQPLEFQIMQKQQIRGWTDEIALTISTKGVIQPFTPQQLILRPEGQRAFRWFTIHALPDLNLSTDDRIKVRGIPYRVMEKVDYTDYGYVQFNVIEDYDQCQTDRS